MESTPVPKTMLGFCSQHHRAASSGHPSQSLSIPRCGPHNEPQQCGIVLILQAHRMTAELGVTLPPHYRGCYRNPSDCVKSSARVTAGSAYQANAPWSCGSGITSTDLRKVEHLAADRIQLGKPQAPVGNSISGELMGAESSTAEVGWGCTRFSSRQWGCPVLWGHHSPEYVYEEAHGREDYSGVLQLSVYALGFLSSLRPLLYYFTLLEYVLH